MMRNPFTPLLFFPAFVNFLMARGADCLKILRVRVGSISIFVVNIERLLCVYISFCTTSLTLLFSKFRVRASSIFVIRVLFAKGIDLSTLSFGIHPSSGRFSLAFIRTIFSHSSSSDFIPRRYEGVAALQTLKNIFCAYFSNKVFVHTNMIT